MAQSDCQSPLRLVIPRGHTAVSTQPPELAVIHLVPQHGVEPQSQLASRVWGDRTTPKVIWQVVNVAAVRAGIEILAPHDLRRTCARLYHLADGELEQIQFLLGHAFVETTERYLGCKQRLRHAVNDHLGIEPDVSSAASDSH